MELQIKKIYIKWQSPLLRNLRIMVTASGEKKIILFALKMSASRTIEDQDNTFSFPHVTISNTRLKKQNQKLIFSPSIHTTTTEVPKEINEKFYRVL